MKTLTQQLVMYANYHRDPRNIITHFVGIPMIVFAVAVLLTRLSFEVSAVSVTGAMVLVGLMSIYYLMLSVPLGLIMAVLFVACLQGAAPLAELSFGAWLGSGIGIFVVGWVFQFVGHFYEGKKPAFVDDLSGLAVGPLFVVCELLFLLGLFRSLKNEVEDQAGPVARQTGLKTEG